MIKLLGTLIYYRILTYLRTKQAVFFTVAFPIFMFIIMSSIWGRAYDGYIAFVLSGVICMTIASDGMFAVGTIIKNYYITGYIKYIKKFPINIAVFFMGTIIAKIINLSVITLFLRLIASFFFNYKLTAIDLLHSFIGIITGLIVFSFIGLVITFSNIKYVSEKGAINIVYFILLFTSDAFYPIGEFNQTIKHIGDLLPFNQMLNLLRYGEFNVMLLFWIIIPIIIFTLLFNSTQSFR